MTDRDALIRAVIAAPENDLPRLVFADWLEERGTKADAARAAFIRLQCELAGTEWLSGPWQRLYDKSEQLLARHRKAWTAHLKGRVIASEFERGFVRHVTVYAKRFVEEADALFAGDPIRSVKFATLASRRGSVPLDRLLDCPALARATDLNFDGSAFDNKALRRLAACPHLAGLKYLSLGGLHAFTGAGVAALLESPRLPALADLDLTGSACLIGGDVATIVRSPGLRKLTDLNLSVLPIGRETARALADSPHAANLRILRLGHYVEDDPGPGEVWATPEGDTTRLGPEGAEALAGSPHLGNLVELDLEGQMLGDAGAAALARSDRLPRLRRLHIGGNGITHKGAESLANSPLARRLCYLNVQFNPGAGSWGRRLKQALPGVEVDYQP